MGSTFSWVPNGRLRRLVVTDPWGQTWASVVAADRSWLSVPDGYSIVEEPAHEGLTARGQVHSG